MFYAGSVLNGVPGFLHALTCVQVIADPEHGVDLRNYQVTSAVVIPLPCLMGHLLHQTLNLPLFSNANLPSPAFVLDRHRSNVSRHVVGHPTLTISATTRWVQISINGEVICIPILWFALLYGVCPLHPVSDCGMCKKGGEDCSGDLECYSEDCGWSDGPGSKR